MIFLRNQPALLDCPINQANWHIYMHWLEGCMVIINTNIVTLVSTKYVWQSTLMTCHNGDRRRRRRIGKGCAMVTPVTSSETATWPHILAPSTSQIWTVSILNTKYTLKIVDMVMIGVIVHGNGCDLSADHLASTAALLWALDNYLSAISQN